MYIFTLFVSPITHSLLWYLINIKTVLSREDDVLRVARSIHGTHVIRKKYNCSNGVVDIIVSPWIRAFGVHKIYVSYTYEQQFSYRVNQQSKCTTTVCYGPLLELATFKRHIQRMLDNPV